ncbi:hypothetical protein AaE_011735, partial [Aphanomyces astaci]
MLLGDSEGNKYRLFIVLKQKKSSIATTVRANINDRNGFGVFVWREVFPLMEQWPSKIYGNPTAWWNEDISVAFLRFHFGSSPNMDEKILLIWDDFSAHFTDKVQDCANEINVILEKVPPRFTWSCQPADVAWNKPFKTQLRRYWIDALMKQIRTHDNSEPFRMVPPDQSTIVAWINEAWTEVLPSTTVA